MGMKELVPCISMIVVQAAFAGMNIFTKLALDSGMSPYVMVTYRQVFATAILIPFAHLLERKTRPRITAYILGQSFLCSLLGATLNQSLYFAGLKYSTPTMTCALNNLLPAITFVLALPFGLETLGLKKRAGQAKVIGTVVCVSGAMLMTFYKGNLIKLASMNIHWRFAEKMRASGSDNATILGAMLVIASIVAWAAWFIVQAKMNEKFEAPYTSTALMCFFASIECALFAVCMEHTREAWSLASRVRLLGALYNGFVGSALTFFFMSWCITLKGPLYVSAFAPLLLIIVAAFDWAILNEKLRVGSVVGSVLIVAGLYIVLWGKDKEMSNIVKVNAVEKAKANGNAELKVNVEEGKTGEEMKQVRADIENVQRI